MDEVFAKLFLSRKAKIRHLFQLNMQNSNECYIKVLILVKSSLD